MSGYILSKQVQPFLKLGQQILKKDQVLSNQGEEIWTSRNGTNTILAVHLRKRRIFILLTWIHKFGSPEVIAIKLGFMLIFTVGLIGMCIVTKGNIGGITKG